MCCSFVTQSKVRLGRMHLETAIKELRMERAHSDQLQKRVERLTRQLAKLQQPRAECQAKRLARMCLKVGWVTQIQGRQDSNKSTIKWGMREWRQRGGHKTFMLPTSPSSSPALCLELRSE